MFAASMDLLKRPKKILRCNIKFAIKPKREFEFSNYVLGQCFVFMFNTLIYSFKKFHVYRSKDSST